MKALWLLACLLLQSTALPGGVKLSGIVARDSTQLNLNVIRLTGVGPRRLARIAADGSFEFLNVQPGTYDVNVVVETGLTVQPVTVVVERKDILGFQYKLQTIMAETDVLVAGWDFQRGRITDPPQLMSPQYKGHNSGPDWSPQGDQIAIQVGAEGSPDGVDLLVHSFSAGSDKLIHPQMSMFSRPRFSPDGHSVVAQGRTAQDPAVAIYEIDLNTGTAKVLITGQAVINPSWSRNKDMLFYEQNFESVFSWNPRTGEKRLIYNSSLRSGGVQTNLNSAPSPDGRILALVEDSALYTIEVATGNKKKLVELKGSDRFLFPGSLAWTPDARWILFGKMTSTAGELWRVSPDGKDLGPADFNIPGKYVYFLRVNPNNKKIAFAVSNNQFGRQ
jgi:Tol biopolymer transport system component